MDNKINTNRRKLQADVQGSVTVLVEIKKKKSFDASARIDETIQLVPEIELDREFGAIPVNSSPNMTARLERDEDIIVTRGKISEEKIKELRDNPNVVNVWLDTDGISPAFVVSKLASSSATCSIPPCDCDPLIPRGDISDVANYLRVNELWNNGFKGENIVVAVQDGGITAEGRHINSEDTSNSEWPNKLIKNVIGGSKSDWGTTGVSWGWHGNMCATDVLGMAPEAKIYDLRIEGNTLSSALFNFDWCIRRHRQDGTPHIITNSWAYYQIAWDPDYTTNPNHVLTRKILEAIDEGIIVLFCAGNCGDTCPDDRCDQDIGSGKSILGANGHQRVITVGAVNKDEKFIGYSSIGPAKLHDRKPDFVSISHFTGFFDSDNGTSAATPIAAGVIALLKQSKPSLTQDEIKSFIMDTCKDIGPSGWDKYSGAGIIKPKEAYERIQNN